MKLSANGNIIKIFSIMTSRPAPTLPNMKEIEAKVRKAKKEKKIFTILGGYDTLRKCLLDREWIEKIPTKNLSLIPSSTERYLFALLLKNHQTDFLWQSTRTSLNSSSSSHPLLNTIMRKRPFNFSSKDGLHSCVLNYKWHHVEGLTDLQYQRSHLLEDRTTRDEFIYDFNTTSCTNFVMFLDSQQDNFLSLFTASSDEISLECVRFAVWKVEQIIKRISNQELDEKKLLDAIFLDSEKKFFTDFRKIINGTKKLKLEGKSSVENCKNLVRESSKKIRHHWPHIKYDGFLNIWVVKPADQSCGRGVQVFDDLDKIIKAGFLPSKTFIVQKYIGELVKRQLGQ